MFWILYITFITVWAGNFLNSRSSSAAEFFSMETILLNLVYFTIQPGDKVYFAWAFHTSSDSLRYHSDRNYSPQMHELVPLPPQTTTSSPTTAPTTAPRFVKKCFSAGMSWGRISRRFCLLCGMHKLLDVSIFLSSFCVSGLLRSPTMKNHPRPASWNYFSKFVNALWRHHLNIFSWHTHTHTLHYYIEKPLFFLHSYMKPMFPLQHILPTKEAFLSLLANFSPNFSTFRIYWT